MPGKTSINNAVLGTDNMFFNSEKYTNNRFSDCSNNCNNKKSIIDECECPSADKEGLTDIAPLTTNPYTCSENSSEFANTFKIRKNSCSNQFATRSFADNNKIVSKMNNKKECCQISDNVNCCGANRCITNRFSKNAKKPFVLNKHTEYTDNFAKNPQINSVLSTNKVIIIGKSRNKRFDTYNDCCDRLGSCF